MPDELADKVHKSYHRKGKNIILANQTENPGIKPS